MCGILRKLMARFQNKETYEKKFGSDLASIVCSRNNQLPDWDNAIGAATKKASAQLKLERRMSVLVSIQTFFSTSVLYLQSYLPLQNTLLKALGKQCEGNCKTGKKLQPKLDVSIVQVSGIGPRFSALPKVVLFLHK